MSEEGDTIAAVATPPGVGGVGVVRISGQQSVEIARKIIRNLPQKIEPRRIYHDWIDNHYPSSETGPVDEVLYYLMKAPQSYTGEDVVEISCHGGPLILREVLGLAVKAGARRALQGEFTKRAFLNGKIDLSQAEAVIDLIAAKTDLGRRSAVNQLGGGLSRRIQTLRGKLLEELAKIEAGIDFPEEIEEQTLSALNRVFVDCNEEIDRLLVTADQGKILREGIKTVIVGKPNVGKSSLLNALLGEERAIVTDIPGTTRDTIEETINIKGMPLVIVDTAGIRPPRDRAEERGIEVAKKEMRAAGLLIIVLDGSAELTDEDRAIFSEAESFQKGLMVLNKIDLGVRINLNGFKFPRFKVSALTGEGIESLKEGVIGELHKGLFWGEVDGMPCINERHNDLLLKAKESLRLAGKSLLGRVPLDLVAIDLRTAVASLGEISGEKVSDEIVKTIFDRFCIGK
jgi:tRNA modification GTPase